MIEYPSVTKKERKKTSIEKSEEKVQWNEKEIDGIVVTLMFLQ